MQSGPAYSGSVGCGSDTLSLARSREARNVFRLAQQFVLGVFLQRIHGSPF